MQTRLILLAFLFGFSNTCLAHSHSPQNFHQFILGVDTANDDNIIGWDFNGWIGDDINKLWLKSEGEIIDGNNTKQAEFWAMYSKNISSFWDGQIGIRRDEPNSINYLIVGFNGLAPYFFQTAAHLFISENGNSSARISQANDLLITQKLIVQPYMELNFSNNKIEKEQIGKGITAGNFGIQTRYEIKKKFAPYIDFEYEREFGGTAKLMRKNDQKPSQFITRIGLSLWF